MGFRKERQPMIYLLTALTLFLLVYLVGFWSTKIYPNARLFRYNQTPDVHITEPKQTMLHNTLATKFCLNERTMEAIDDGDKILMLSQWVFQLWVPKLGHSSKSENPLTIISRADKGERFSRQDYNTVLANAMMSIGIPTRLTTLQTRDCAWRPWASSTTGIEYFDHNHFKWAWFDGKYGIRVLQNNTPLNLLEIKEAVLSESRFELHPDYREIDIEAYINTLTPYLDIIIAQPIGQTKRYALIPPQLTIPNKKFWIGEKLFDISCHSPVSFYASHPIKQLVKANKTKAIDIRTRKPVTS